MNLTDRELLELAAKAAGLKNARYCPEEDGLLSCIEYDDENDCTAVWMPHLDNGDALLLAIDLCFSVMQYKHSVEIMIGNELIHRELSDGTMTRVELTRWAIVRAAAAIQLSKEGK